MLLKNAFIRNAKTFQQRLFAVMSGKSNVHI